MKFRLILTLTLLTVVLSAGERPYFLKLGGNPASRSEWYYTTWNFRLESSFEDDDDAGRINLNYHRPTRSGWGFFAMAQYQYESNDGWTTGGIGMSRRFSSILHTGLDLEAGWRQQDEQTTISIHPGFTIIPFGNLRLGLHDRYTYLPDAQEDENLLTASASLIFNEYVTTRFTWDTDNVYDAEVLGNPGGGTGIGVFWGMSLDADGPMSDTMYRAGMAIQLEGWFSQYGETFDERKPMPRDFRMSFMFGDYTPPVAFEARHYSISKTPRQYRTLAITESIEDFQPDETEITIEKGDNLTRISRNLPVNADPSFRDNIRQIAEFNSIDDPSRIYVGQKIRIPILKPSVDTLKISEVDRLLVEDLLDRTYNTRIVETSISSALWSFRLDGVSAMRERLPSHSILDYPQLLNAQALSNVYSGEYDQAEDLLQWAVKARATSPILKKNLETVMQFTAGSYEKE